MWSREEHARIRVEGADGAGLPVEIDGSTGFLDGGVPTYGWMGAHFSEPPRIGSINLLGRKIGRITRVEKRSCIADCEPFRLTLNGVEVGLYTALYPRGGCNVHVAPRVPRALRLREGEEVEILLAGNP
jgi:hypothetical protein